MSKARDRQVNDDRPLRLGRPRAALVVYRVIDGRPHVLLVGASKTPGKLTLPGGKIDAGETPMRAAMRETAEEAGVLTDPPQALGEYLHRKSNRRYHPTQTFLARFVGTLHEYEGRARRWLDVEALRDPSLKLRKPIRKQLASAFASLERRRAAA
ncbi:MAG: NUDIX hydrolase [Phycisphaeraceae bacterium]